MPKSYSSTPTKTAPAILDDETLLAIGKIVRSFAEIENLIDLYISGLAQLPEAKTAILLGRMGISRKIETASYLASMTGKTITEIHSKLFNEHYRDLLYCRNVMAHGYFLGRAEDGSFAFKTNQSLEPEVNTAAFTVATFRKSEIIRTASVLDDFIGFAITVLKLQPSLDKLSQPTLQGHRKGQPQRKKSAKRKPKPQS